MRRIWIVGASFWGVCCSCCDLVGGLCLYFILILVCWFWVAGVMFLFGIGCF